MKASVADAAGTAPDTHAPIHICRSRGRESTTARSTVGSQFAADAVSDGRIAICYCLLRFANRASSQPSLGESEVYVCPRTWPPKPLAARRTRAGIGTIAGGPACLGSNVAAGTRIGGTTERVSFESRFATACAGVQIGNEAHALHHLIRPGANRHPHFVRHVRPFSARRKRRGNRRLNAVVGFPAIWHTPPLARRSSSCSRSVRLN